MSKEHSIIWTPKSSETYLDALSFILEKWTRREAEYFESLTNELLERLRFNIKLCPESKIKSLRKCVVSEQTSLVYRVKAKNIELITFIDNRSNHKY